MTADDAQPDSGPVQVNPPLIIPSQLGWLLEHPDVAREAITALVAEPISRSERKQLNRLLDTMRSSADEVDDARKRSELSNKLSAREFTWLPARSSIRTRDLLRPGTATEESRVTTSQMLASIVRSIHQPPHVGFSAALVYPLIVLGFSLLVLGGLCLVVVPSFEVMFDEFGLMLPAPTRLLFTISQIVRLGLWFWLSVLLTVAIAGFTLFLMRTALVNFYRGLGLRRRGSTSELVAMSRFARGLAELIEANTPPADAIRLAAVRCGHPYYEKSAAMLAAEARSGTAGLRALRIANRFPANLIEALTGGDKSTGRPNVPLLLSLAELYDERAAGRVERDVTIPAILTVVAVAGMVGFAALSLFMPLIELITGLT